MAIVVTDTGQVSEHPKILVYGPSGIGKTRLCKTARKPIIISSENKLVSLRQEEITVLQVKTIDDFEEAIQLVQTKKYLKKYSWACVDSISDIAESAVAQEKSNWNDPRKAYGVVQDKMLDLLKGIRDSETIPWYIIAKAKMTQNDENVDMWGPKMPGRQMGPELPYIFDFIFAMRQSLDDDPYVYLQTDKLDDYKWEAKDSSGTLDPREEPNLTKLLNKIRGK